MNRHFGNSALAGWVLAAMALLASALAEAGGLRVHPLRLSLEGEQRVAELRVGNTRDRESMLQVQVLRWSHSRGRMQLSEAPELVVSPPAFLLAPGGEQVVRIGRRSTEPLSVEAAYRVVVEEVPRGQASGQGLRMVMRMRLPFFIRPEAVAPALRFSLQEDCLRVRNHGGRHARLTELAVGAGGTGAEDWQAIDIASAPYLLAGETRCLSWTGDDAVDAARVRYAIRDGGGGERALE